MTELVDLRSDTVSRPTEGMRAAMAKAEVGDDVFGDDPTCHALEQRVAEELGHEAAIFTVTGSLANLLAVRSLVPTGGEVICESTAHIVRAELGAHAILAGTTTRTWTAPRGQVDLDAIRVLLAPDSGPYFVSTAAVAVENTHNFGGGSVQPIEVLRKLREETHASGVALHLDGARLWNAHVATGLPLAEFADLFDTIAVCLSKGLGAPIGSLAVGSADQIAEARVWRKRYGAGWRQAGVLAAAGLYALDHHVDRLADDHANAKAMATLLADAVPGSVDPAEVETNIVILDLSSTGRTGTDVAEAVRKDGIVLAGGKDRLRLVTHLDVDAAGCKRAAEAIAKVLTAA